MAYEVLVLVMIFFLLMFTFGEEYNPSDIKFVHIRVPKHKKIKNSLTIKSDGIIKIKAKKLSENEDPPWD